MDERKKVFAFHGVDFKVGSTMITQSAAQMIANDKKELKILVLFLNGRKSTNYCREELESIEAIRAGIDNEMLTKKEFMQICWRTGNLYMLAGISRLFEQRLYRPEMAEYLVSLVRDAFDMIMIDGGNEIDNGLALGGLRTADERLLILTQQESVLERYDTVKDVYKLLGLEFGRMIVNKYIQEDPHDLAYMAKRLTVEKEKLLPVGAAKYARQAEIDYKTLLAYREAVYKEGVFELAGFLLAEAGITPMQHGKVGRVWKNFI